MIDAAITGQCVLCCSVVEWSSSNIAQCGQGLQGRQPKGNNTSMVRPRAIFAGVFLLVVVRLLIDPWLSSESHVLSRPVVQPTRTTPTVWQPQDAATYIPYGDERYDDALIAHPTWPGAKVGYPVGQRYEDDLIHTLYEYNIPAQLVPEREAYHISISAELISPRITRDIYRAAKPLCKTMGKHVAIVGNGPIREADMQALEANASCVIRFNRISLKYAYYFCVAFPPSAIAHRAAAGRTDIWALRHNEKPPIYYWGANASWSGIDVMVEHTPIVVFIGGEVQHVRNATLSVPQLRRTKVCTFIVTLKNIHTHTFHASTSTSLSKIMRLCTASSTASGVVSSPCLPPAFLVRC